MDVAAPDRMLFDLNDVPRQHRSKTWMDALNTFFYDFDLRLPTDFAMGELEGGQAGDLTIASVKSDAMTVHRTASHIARDALDSYFVLLPTDHRIALGQRGSEVAVQDKQFALVSTSDSYSYKQENATRFNNLIIPGKVLRQAAPHIDDHVASAPRDTILSRMFYDLADSLCSNFASLDEHARRVVGKQAVELLGLILDGADHVSNSTPIKTAHYRRIINIIDRNYTNPKFNIRTIANNLKISERYIQAIFADHGTTVSHVIRERRIAEACRLIGRGTATRTSVTEIAYQVGFSDLPHFSRVFKQKTGFSPSEFEI